MMLKILYYVLLSNLAGVFTIEEGIPKNSKEIDKIEELNNVSEPCPSNMSSFSANDLGVIIDEIMDKFKIYEQINASYYVNATTTRDSIKQKIDGFTSWIVDKPEHLKHILEEIASQRQFVEDQMSKLEDVERQYNESSQKYFMLLDELAEQEHICQLNCYPYPDDVDYYWSDEIILNRADVNRSDSKYCSSYRSVRDLVNSKLQSFLDETLKFVGKKLQTDERAYIDKVNDFEHKMKMVALEEFGQIMYDVLDIKDQYFHLHKEIKDTIINQIVVQLTNVQMNLKNLECAIKEYANNCQYCIYSNGLQLISRDARDAHQKENNNPEIDEVDEDKSKNILETLLETKTNDIKNKINDDFVSIFEDINQLLDITHMNDSLSNLKSHLEKLWSEINDITQKEISNVEQLKDKAPKSISNLEKLLEDVNLLANDIVKSLRDIIKM